MVKSKEGLCPGCEVALLDKPPTITTVSTNTMGQLRPQIQWFEFQCQRCNYVWGERPDEVKREPARGIPNIESPR